MNVLDARPDQVKDTRNIFVFAAILSAGFAAIGLIGESLEVVAYSLIPAALCGVGGVLLSLIGLLLAPGVRNLYRLSTLLLSAYVFVATLAIHFAGGPQSFLTALYIGITVGAAFLIGRRGAVSIAILSTACFSLLVWLEFSGLIAIHPIWEAALNLDGRGVVLAGLIFSMVVPTVVVAYVTGTLADRLAQRTAEQLALALIARDVASRLNPDEVIHTVLQRAIANTPSDRGAIYLYDSDRLRLSEAASVNMLRSLEEGYADLSWNEVQGVIGRVLRTGQTACIDDVAHDPDYTVAAPDSRSELCVPIIQDGHTEGILNLESNRLNAYADTHQRFVEQLAQHAALALKNARLYAKTERNLYEVARANLEIRALQESLSAIQSALELDAVLQRICDAVVTLGYDLATLAIIDRSGVYLTVRANAAADAELLASLRSKLGLELMGLRTKLRPTPGARNIGLRALAERRVLVSKHTVDFLYPAAGSSGARSKALEALGLRIGAAIPLIARNVPLGILYVFNRKPELSAMDLSSLQAFGAQAAVALDKANLFEDARTVRDRLQAVLDATHDGLILYDAQTRMVLTNRAAEQLLGISLTSHLGRPMASVLNRSGLIDLLYPKLNAEERQAVIDTEVNVMTAGLRDGASEVARRLITVPGSETRFVEEFNLRVQDEHGQLMGRLVVLHNVTDQKQLEADRDAFTQMLVHDLRSPLSAIISGLQLIQLSIEEGDPAELLLKSVRVALASSNKLLGLIGSLLDVQKLETGQLELQAQPLAPASLIEEALEALRPLAELSDITLDMEADYDLPPVQGDSDHLRRVLTNLVDNALKFVGSGGRIRVSAQAGDGFIQFSVADNGPGIPPDYRERIFERYVQVPGRAGRRRGTGLGLTYCRMVVEMHGGRIRVDTSPEGGSNFVFTLPTARTPNTGERG
ncbi:MAG TPA: GAF domain-containing protein [Anaerolineae bacterium]|nr:GAF domain-containing protein [Anaerolineae bacterium]